MQNWKLLTNKFDSEIHKTLQVQHLAAQYIALTGRYLIPETEDKNNITMQFIPGQDMLLGRQHPDGWLVCLLLETLDDSELLGEWFAGYMTRQKYPHLETYENIPPRRAILPAGREKDRLFINGFEQCGNRADEK